MDSKFIKKIKIDWNKVDKKSYVRNISSISNIDEIKFNKPITFFTGENGSGKSTLLEAIAISYGFNAEGGTKNYNFSTHDSYSDLNKAIKIVKGYKMASIGYFLRAESFYNVATKEEDYSDLLSPSKNFHNMSHGESFLRLLDSYVTNNGIYILDEPEAALSPNRQMQLLSQIYEYSKLGSQFIIATNSPIILATPNSEILSFDDGKIHMCQYEETTSYKITKLFVNHKDNVVKELIQD